MTAPVPASPAPKPPQSAFLAGYDGLRFTLPNGREVTAKVLPLGEALALLELYEQWRQTGNNDFRRQFVERFPPAVGLVAELNQLTLEEFWDAVGAFFADRERAPTSPEGGAAASTSTSA